MSTLSSLQLNIALHLDKHTFADHITLFYTLVF